MTSNLHRGIYIALEPVHWGPDMLLDFKQLADAQVVFRTVAIFDQGFGLFIINQTEHSSESQCLPLV